MFRFKDARLNLSKSVSMPCDTPSFIFLPGEFCVGHKIFDCIVTEAGNIMQYLGGGEGGGGGVRRRVMHVPLNN